MLRQWHSRCPVVLADKSALDAESDMNKACISNHKLLQSQQLIQIDRITTCFGNCPPPPLNSVLRRAFTLDRIARFGVLQ